MNYENFFYAGEHYLPIRWEKFKSFDEALSITFESRRGLLESIEEPDEIVARILEVAEASHRLGDSIEQAVQGYLNGDPHRAYTIFASALESLLSIPAIKGALIHSVPLTLFRLRVGDTPMLSRSEIFHVPFEKRQNLATQRFSIPGFPALYLGGSLWVAWEEMGRPPFNQAHASCFQSSAPLSFLDLGWRPAMLPAYLSRRLAGEMAGIDPVEPEDASKFAVMCGMLWPLMAACNFATKDRKAPFKPEYIVPQLLMIWLKNNGIDGIRYATTLERMVGLPPHFASNYAFPAKQSAREGCCSWMTEQFTLSTPVSLDLLASVYLDEVYPLGDNDEARLLLPIDEKWRSYRSTTLFHLEAKLRILKSKKVDDE